MNVSRSTTKLIAFRLVGVALLFAVGMILLNDSTRGPLLDLLNQVSASFGTLAGALQGVLDSPPAG